MNADCTGRSILSRLCRMRLSLFASLAIGALVGAVAEPALAVEPIDVHFFNAQQIRLDAKLYRPAGDARYPAVVMMHGCSGMFSNSNPANGVQSVYSEWADRLVDAGYVALLVDSFTPRGAEQNQCGNGAEGVSEVSDRPLDAIAAHRYLKNRSWVYPRRIGLLGWSHGASSTLATLDVTTTATRIFRAAVAFYPGCGLFDAFGGINDSAWTPRTPIRILHGAIDPLYTAGHCQTRVQHAQLLTGIPVELRAYAGAQHSFDYATEVGDEWTQADVDAKTKGDLAAMRWFNRRLMPAAAPL